MGHGHFHGGGPGGPRGNFHHGGPHMPPRPYRRGCGCFPGIFCFIVVMGIIVNFVF